MIEPLALDWGEIKKGMTVTGQVVKLEKFGAFIEIGAERPGLAHISELAHEYLKRPEDLLKVGQDVQVMVLDTDRKKKQIKLSMKALQEPPTPEVYEEDEEQDNTPALTAMEIAYRKALGGADEESGEAEKQGSQGRGATAQDDIIARTLEQKHAPSERLLKTPPITGGVLY
jgi:predicted RNA-binding protein with RPS1 domain